MVHCFIRYLVCNFLFGRVILNLCLIRSSYNSVALMQVDELTDEFDARRSTGYLCAATAGNFEQVLFSAKFSHVVISFEEIELPILKIQSYPTL